MDFLHQKHATQFCICLLLLISLRGNSQESSSDVRLNQHHEITVNTLTLSISQWADFSYEYLIDERSSLGMDLQFGFGQTDPSEKQRVFSFTPNYRRYFSESYASGYFAEFFGVIYNQKETLLNSDGSIVKQEIDFSLGMSLGQKWVFKKGFILEIFLGVGTVVLDRQGHFSNVTGRTGISLGYRF